MAAVQIMPPEREPFILPITPTSRQYYPVNFHLNEKTTKASCAMCVAQCVESSRIPVFTDETHGDRTGRMAPNLPGL